MIGDLARVENFDIFGRSIVWLAIIASLAIVLDNYGLLLLIIISRLSGQGLRALRLIHVGRQLVSILGTLGERWQRNVHL